MTLRPGKFCRKAGKKGQQEGDAVKSATGKLRVAGTCRKTTGNAPGRNNSNLTPIAASVANGEWELF
jgi:hypothetical protein